MERGARGVIPTGRSVFRVRDLQSEKDCPWPAACGTQLEKATGARRRTEELADEEAAASCQAEERGEQEAEARRRAKARLADLEGKLGRHGQRAPLARQHTRRCEPGRKSHYGAPQEPVPFGLPASEGHGQVRNDAHGGAASFRPLTYRKWRVTLLSRAGC